MPDTTPLNAKDDSVAEILAMVHPARPSTAANQTVIDSWANKDYYSPNPFRIVNAYGFPIETYTYSVVVGQDEDLNDILAYRTTYRPKTTDEMAIIQYHIDRGVVFYENKMTSSLDPFDAFVTLLMRFNSYPFVDDKGHTVTTVGTPTRGTTTPVEGEGYMLGQSPSNYLSVPLDALSLAGDYCVEGYIRYGTVDNTTYLLSSASGGGYTAFEFRVGSLGDYRVMASNGSAWTMVNPSQLPTNENVWHHIAVAVKSGLATIYFDGVAQTDAINIAMPTYMALGAAWYIGIGAGGAANGLGHLDLLRVTSGHCRYEANFTPAPY